MDKLTKIMLVEDDDNIREIAVRVLVKLCGLEVIPCASGQEALDRVLLVQPQLIMLDVMMPGLDGISTLNKLRQMEGAKHIPVIFSTARVQPKQIEEYLKIGAIGVISKPFEPATLGNAIQEIWLNRREQSLKVSNSSTATGTLDAKREALADLSEAYSKEIPAKIAAIKNSWQLLCTSWDENNRKQLYLLVHQFAGSSGTLGFMDLSEQLKQIEVLLELQEQKAASDEVIHELDRMVTQLSMVNHAKIARNTMLNDRPLM